MRILALFHRIPYPPDKGEKIRAFHQLKAMAAHHEVDVFTLADDARDLASRETLAKYCRSLTVARVHPRAARLKSLPYWLTGTPLTIPYFRSVELYSEIRRAFAERTYDRVFVYCSAMAQYLDTASQIPVVMDLVDVDSDKWTQYAAHTAFPMSTIYRREGRTLRAYERGVCERAACALVSTEREATLLQQIAPRAHIEVLPNGVDADYFQPPREAATEPAVVFTGDMGYFPNQEAVVFFARQVLPGIRREVAGARFLIVGRNPSRQVQELAKTEGIEVTGFVPDVRTWLARAQVAVAPFTIAAGIQNKILEALAFGLPVVATPRAAQGLTPQVAGAVEQASSAGEFAAKVTQLLRNPQLARAQGAEGRRRVIEDYSWPTAMDRFLQVLEHPGASISTRPRTKAGVA